MNHANRSGRFLGIKIAEEDPSRPVNILGPRSAPSPGRDSNDIIAQARLSQIAAMSGKVISPGQAMAQETPELEAARKKSEALFKAYFRQITTIMSKWAEAAKRR